MLLPYVVVKSVSVWPEKMLLRMCGVDAVAGESLSAGDDIRVRCTCRGYPTLVAAFATGWGF